jgi:hypothetical protein
LVYLFVKGLLRKANPVSEDAPDREERLQWVVGDKLGHINMQNLFYLEAKCISAYNCPTIRSWST